MFFFHFALWHVTDIVLLRMMESSSCRLFATKVSMFVFQYADNYQYDMFPFSAATLLVG